MPEFIVDAPGTGILGDFGLPDRSSITINDKTWIENPEEPTPINPFGVPLNTAWYLTEPWREEKRGVVQNQQYDPILANYPVTVTLFVQNIHGNGSINGPLNLVDITNDAVFTLIAEDESFETGREGKVLLERTTTFPEPPPTVEVPCTVNTFLKGQGIDAEVPVVGEVPCILALIGIGVVGTTLLVVD